MQTHLYISTVGVIGGLLFFLALGAICGSFINVLVYRIPRGLNIVVPPSACPACGTKLTWRENIPVLGWLLLRGRCRFCRSAVSIEYPMVEFAVAVLFAAFYLWFADPLIMERIGIDIRAWRPEWAADGLWRMWPTLLIILCLAGSFVAATLIDARTFLIPIVIPWFATAVAFIVHPLHALWIANTRGSLQSASIDWTLPTVAGSWLGAAVGGVAGIVASLALLAAGVLPRSFSDYDEWEKRHTEASPPADPVPDAAPVPTGPQREDVRLTLRKALFLTGPAVALMFMGFTIGLRADLPFQGMAVGLGLGLIVGLLLRRLADGGGAEEPAFLQYPHARREMLKEILFLAAPVLLAVLGAWMCRPGGALGELAATPPLWVRALGGSLLGYLIAGGVVWATRIGGTLAVNTEAMGAGDIHLLAAAGAALGWIDPVLAFFTAPFFGLGWAALGALSRRVFGATGTALPYGPHLALATLCVLLAKPLYESLLSWVIGEPVNIP